MVEGIEARADSLATNFHFFNNQPEGRMTPKALHEAIALVARMKARGLIGPAKPFDDGQPNGFDQRSAKIAELSKLRAMKEDAVKVGDFTQANQIRHQIERLEKETI